MLGLVRNGEFNLGIAADPVVEAGDRLLVAEAATGAAHRAADGADRIA